MTLDLAENVPNHILKLNYSNPSKLTLKTRPQKADLYRPQTKIGTIELKHWLYVDVSMVTKCTQFDQKRPTPTSNPTTLSKAEALNYIFI